jgi:Icc-related predicted phosphoesterase
MPVWFGHISDPHISTLLPQDAERLRNILDYYARVIQPETVVITGDLTDQYQAFDPLPEIDPELPPWLDYFQIVNSSGVDVLDVLGNHDTWGLLSEASAKNYCLRYSTIGRGPEFYSETFFRGGVRFITFQPFRFPSGSGMTGFFIRATEEMLTRLETQLTATVPVSTMQTILLSHFPSDAFWPQDTVSQTGRLFKNLTNYVDAFLNGHFHPHTPIVQPFGATIEFVAPAIKSGSRFQIVVVDHRRISYHSFDYPPAAPAVVTMPVPYKQSRYTYRDPSEVRVLAFEGGNGSHFVVSGDVSGELEPIQEVKSGVWLYSMPISLDNGMHKITISGDIDVEIEFAVNCETPQFEYAPSMYFNCWSVIVAFTLMTFWHLVVLFGLFWSGRCVESLKLTHKWIRGSDVESKWIIAILFGPAVVGRGMRKLPLPVKALYLLMVAWGFCLPVGLFKIEDTIAAIWVFGYIVKGKVMLEFMYLLFPALFLGLVLFGWVCVLALYDYQPHWSFGIDVLVALGCLAGALSVWVLYGAGIADHTLWLASFEFFIFPIIFIVISFVLYWKRWSCKKKVDRYGEELAPEY